MAGQVRLEPHRKRSSDVRPAFVFEADLLAYDTASTVASDRVACPNDIFGTRRILPHDGMHVLRILADANQFGSQPDIRTVCLGSVEQQRLHQVLWRVAHAARTCKLVVGVASRPRSPR